MKIGVVSDSHDNLPNVEKAVDAFNSEGVVAVIHCGDFVAPFSLLPFRRLECGSFHAVFGNNDGEREGLLKIASDNGWFLENGPYRFEIGGKKITAMHEPAYLDGVLGDGGTDIIVSGHLHKVKVEKVGGVLVLNPGEAGGWITGRPTIAVVETETLEARIIGL
jgi:hypothetical protein